MSSEFDLYKVQKDDISARQIKTDLAIAQQRIADLEAAIKPYMDLDITASDREGLVRLDERRKVAEDCIAEASKWITTKWRQKGMADAVHAKYLA
jgi:hypothetical protein